MFQSLIFMFFLYVESCSDYRCVQGLGCGQSLPANVLLDCTFPKPPHYHDLHHTQVAKLCWLERIRIHQGPHSLVLIRPASAKTKQVSFLSSRCTPNFAHTTSYPRVSHYAHPPALSLPILTCPPFLWSSFAPDTAIIIEDIILWCLVVSYYFEVISFKSELFFLSTLPTILSPLKVLMFLASSGASVYIIEGT